MKDRILENISLSVKKVSGLLRPGPLFPVAVCRSPTPAPRVASVAGTPGPAGEAGGSGERRSLGAIFKEQS